MAHVPDPSFPSDHATVFFALGVTLLRSPWRPLGVLVLLFGVAVGWARVYLGVHFPFDIVGSLAVAVLSSSLAWRMLASSWFGPWLLDSVEVIYRRLFAPAIAKGWIRG